MKNANMPAFPVKGANNTPFTLGDAYEDYVQQCEPTVGLTKREYFAAMAMQGICASHVGDQYHVNNGWLHADTVAKSSIEIADALIKQLEP